MRKINEIFYSLQGEGFHTGTPAVFIRLSGCNLKCPFCDTQHEEGVLMTDEEIMAEVGKYPAMMVILTGGEPSLWIDREFVDRLHRMGKYVCIETNGTHELPDNIDWVTCSPKRGAKLSISRMDALGHRWQRVGWKLALKLMGLGALTCLTSILYCYAMSVLPAPVALTLLFQFTWLGLVWQTVMTRRPPRPLQVASALAIVFGTVFASGVYKTGITGYDPVALLCALGAAVSCSLFVTLSGKVEAPCSSEQRGVIVCAGSVVMSLTVCPDYVVSGVLAQGILPFAVIAGFFGMLCPVLLFGMGSPHLPAGLSTVMAAAELPAGLLIAMIVLGEPLGVVEWLGVAIILAGVCLAQVPSLLGGREARRAAAGQAVS